ncbi:MAG: hypothetical protein ACKVS6_00800 [Planctomycetota bacterium]
MDRHKQSKREARIQVALTARELDLLRDATFGDPVYADRFTKVNGAWMAKFKAWELEDMIGFVAAAANHARRAKLENELDSLYEHLEMLEHDPSGMDIGDAL